jgi:diguanylate cyclase (GGDEF)-like protein
MLDFLGFFVFIRLGLNRRFADPSLTVPQMLAALVFCATAYALAGAGRGAVLPTPIVVMIFGMYSLDSKLVRRLGWFAITAFGITMAAMATLAPAVYDPLIEACHFFVFAAMLSAVTLLADRLSRLRQRLRTQKAELTQALARIQDLATRDELTGLVNRRYMQDMLKLEHQRCVRSGHPFCVAMIDLDHFKRINDSHGHAAGDAVLRGFAVEAQQAIRVSDVLGRWGGEEFLLLMTDTRGPLGRLGLERLRERVGSLRIRFGELTLQVSFSGGLAEHRAGESLADTIARADQAVYAAKAAGRNKVVLL